MSTMENKEINYNLNPEERPNRCVLIMNTNLTGGHLANAIAVIALTIGQRHPYLVGAPLIDASDHVHPGLIPIGIPMLQCNSRQLTEIRLRALEKECDVVDFPLQGQQTKDYNELLDMMTKVTADELEFLGIAIVGKKNVVNRLTKHCDMIR